VLDALRVGNEVGIDDGGVPAFIQSLRAFGQQALHAPAARSPRTDAQQLTRLFKAPDLLLGLVQVVEEGGGELLALRSLGHAGQRPGELLLGAVDVAQLGHEKGLHRIECHVSVFLEVPVQVTCRPTSP
jgi:hypothetical protein